jgi:PAS domain S-box-containing protein
VRNSSKEIIGGLQIGLDITYRKIIEKKQIEHNLTLQQYFDAAPYAIAIADKTGKYVDVNKKVTELLGYTREEMLQMTVLDVYYPEDPNKFALHFNAMIENGNYILEDKLTRKDGSTFEAHLEAVELADERYMSFFTNIDDRKESERRLKLSEERFRLLVKHSPNGIMMLDETGAILEINDQFLSILGSESKDETLKINCL